MNPKIHSIPNYSYGRKSIAARLLRLVFGSYFIVAILVTVIQLKFEYDNTKEKLLSSAREVAHAFSPSLSMAVWRYDANLLQESLFGLVNADSVVGAQIIEPTGEKMIMIGKVVGENNTLQEYDKYGKLITQISRNKLEGLAEELYPYRFSLTRPDGNEKEKNQVIAEGVIYSARSQVIAWVKEGFILIIINSLIKTAALWFIFLLFANKIIAKPLSSLTKLMDTFDSERDFSEDEQLNSTLQQRPDELGIMFRAFIKMRMAIIERIKYLQMLNLTSEKMAKARNAKEVCEIIITQVQNQFRFEESAIQLVGRFKNILFTLNSHPHPLLAKILEEQREILNAEITTTGFFQSENEILFYPLKDGKTVWGMMAFKTGSSFSYNEEKANLLASLARSAAISLSILEKVEIIEEYNHNLEELVEERTAALKEKAWRIETLLQNVSLGIFTFSTDLKIQNEYSRYLESIVEKQSISGLDALDLLFSNSDLGLDQINLAYSVFYAALGQDIINYKLNEHLLPKRFSKSIGNKIKTLEVMWEPQIGLDGCIERVMVVIRDVTDLRQMEQETVEQKRELQIIDQIINVRPAFFEDFIAKTEKNIRECYEQAVQNAQIDIDMAKNILGKLHTLKGSSRLFKLTTIADEIHNTEGTIANVLNSNKVNKKDLILASLQDLKKIVSIYVKLYKSKIRKLNDLNQEKEIINRCVEKLQDMRTRGIQVDDSAFKEMTSLLIFYTSRNLTNILSQHIKGLPSLAIRQGIKPPIIDIIGDHLKFSPQFSSIISDAMVHFIMNSLAHGIEKTEERLKLGKPLAGRITISAEKLADKRFSLRYKDDGRGLNIPAIKEKGIIKRLITSDESSVVKIANLILSSGFSTSSGENIISGRGVGINAIIDLLKEHNGRLEMKLLEKDTLGNNIPFEWVITLPFDDNDWLA